MIVIVPHKPRHQLDWPGSEPTLQGVFAMPIRNPIRTFLCFVLVFLATGGLYLASPAKFTARVDVVIVAVTGTSSAISDRDVSIDSAVQILYSDSVVGQTAREIGYPGRSSGLLEDLTISPVINSRILRLYVANADPRIAFETVSLLTENFLAERGARLAQLAQIRRGELKAGLDSLTQQVTELGRSDTPITERREMLSNLSAERTQLEFAIAALDTIPPEPGFISRQPVLPTTAHRPMFASYFASALAIAITLSYAAAPNRLTSTGRRSATSPKTVKPLFQGSTRV